MDIATCSLSSLTYPALHYSLPTTQGKLCPLKMAFSKVVVKAPKPQASLCSSTKGIDVLEDYERLLEKLEEEEFGENARTGRDPNDYRRRADVFGRTAEVVVAFRRKKEEIVAEKLQSLEEEVIQEDCGKTSDDYRRRAEIFNKTGELFAVLKK